MEDWNWKRQGRHEQRYSGTVVRGVGRGDLDMAGVRTALNWVGVAQRRGQSERFRRQKASVTVGAGEHGVFSDVSSPGDRWTWDIYHQGVRRTRIWWFM
jgi:hypothetical protein